MTATFCTVYQRFSTDIEFPTELSEIADYISSKYSKKCISWREPFLSEDKLVLVQKSVWINLDELLIAQEQEKESLIFKQAQQAITEYCEENQIVTFNYIE